MVVHACNPSTWEAETGGSQVRGQLQLLSEALRNFVRPGFLSSCEDFLFFFAVLGIEPRDILPPSYSPSPILFFILKQGLTKLRRASLSS